MEQDYKVVLDQVLRLAERGEYERAANVLLSGFTWGHTPQGSSFWDRIYCRLKKEAVIVAA